MQQSEQLVNGSRIENAGLVVIHIVQAEMFAPEIKNLRLNRPINTNSSIISLDPFLATDGLLHVGGRLISIKQQFTQF